MNENKVKYKSVFENKEYILCAAFNYDGKIISGYRHSDCNDLLEMFLGKDYHTKYTPEEYRQRQGFLTSKKRFVDRAEGYRIAKDCNQLWLEPVKGEDEHLISENLYYYVEDNKMR